MILEDQMGATSTASDRSASRLTPAGENELHEKHQRAWDRAVKSGSKRGAH